MWRKLAPLALVTAFIVGCVSAKPPDPWVATNKLKAKVVGAYGDRWCVRFVLEGSVDGSRRSATLNFENWKQSMPVVGDTVRVDDSQSRFPAEQVDITGVLSEAK